MTSNKTERNQQSTKNDCSSCSNNPIVLIRGVVCEDCVVNMNANGFNRMIQKRRYVHEEEADECNWHYNHQNDSWHYQHPDLQGVNSSVLCFTDDELKQMKKLRLKVKNKKRLERKTKREVKQNKQSSMTSFFNPK